MCWRQGGMIAREAVHFPRAQNMRTRMARGSNIAGVMKFVRDAESRVRRERNEREAGCETGREGFARRAHRLGKIIATRQS